MKVKVKITYTPEQEPKARAALDALRGLFPSARVHETNKQDRVKAVYLTVSSPENQLTPIQGGGIIEP